MPLVQSTDTAKRASEVGMAVDTVAETAVEAEDPRFQLVWISILPREGHLIDCFAKCGPITVGCQ